MKQNIVVPFHHIIYMQMACSKLDLSITDD